MPAITKIAKTAIIIFNVLDFFIFTLVNALDNSSVLQAND